MSESDSTHTPLLATDEERRRMLNRLRRLEGQIRGLQTMIESGTDCEPLITQVMAAKAALNQIGLLVIGHAMKECMTSSEARTREEIVDEALAVLLRYVNLPDRWEAPID